MQTELQIRSNNNLFLSGYFGRDVFSLNKSFTNIYGNSILKSKVEPSFLRQNFQISPLFTVTITMGWT
jgi:hypothetical protein